MAISNKDRLFEILRQYYHRINKTVTKQTMTVYQNKILKIYMLLDIDDITTTEQFLDIEKISLLLEINFKNLNSRCTYLSSLLVWLHANQVHKDFIKKYQNLLFDLTKEKQDSQREKMKINKLTISKFKILLIKKEFENKILNIFNNFEPLPFGLNRIVKRKGKIFLQNYLLFLFYSGLYIPPCRNNLNNLLILNEAKDEITSEHFNYICCKKKEIIYKDFKTSKTHGVIHVKIPNEFFEIIMKIKPFICIDNFPFKNLKNGKCYNSNAFGKRIKTIFNGEATINDLRHLYLTSKYAKLKELLKELVIDTRAMGNSSSVALDFYVHDTLKSIKEEVK